ncbi:MAG: GTPase, partial [Candidatus ainarchaeum sp.]|nr:GTPase [Candidatus ainarchaeum sp.]
RPHAVGSIKEAYKKYDHMESVVPAMGYYGKQIEDLAETINRSGAEIVVSGTPIDITKTLKVKIPVLHVRYDMKERVGSLEAVIDKFLKH